MSLASDLQIDEAILSVAKTSWRKVALVIVEAAEIISGHLPDDALADRIAERVAILVRDGQLLAQGNIKKWRHSEVRKPN